MNGPEEVKSAPLSMEEQRNYWHEKWDKLYDEFDALKSQLAASEARCHNLIIERDKALEAEIAFTKSRPCGGCPEGHDSYWKTVVESPQWKSWSEKTRDYDTAECESCGFISQKHFQAFIEFLLAPEKAARVKAEAERNDLVLEISKANAWEHERQSLLDELARLRTEVTGLKEALQCSDTTVKSVIEDRMRLQDELARLRKELENARKGIDGKKEG